MGFFDDFDLPQRDEDDEEEYEQPEWYGPSRGWLGGVVPLETLVARSDIAAVYLTRFVAYPTGFSMSVNTLARSPRDVDIPFHMDLHEMELMHGQKQPTSVEDIPPELLRFGVEYADGRKASTFGRWMGGSSYGLMFADSEEEGPDPDKDLVLMSGGGGGGDAGSQQEYWVWPLPPAGPIRFVCEWPKLGIPETVVEVDGEVIRGASERAVQVWGESST